MWTVVLLTLYRLISPLLLFLFPPMPALIAYLLGESLDWYVFPMHLYDWSGYQVWDKFMDVWFMVVATVYAHRYWQEAAAKKLLFLLFIYRLLGVLLFEIFAARPLLLVFPNLFDLFFVFYLFYRQLTHRPLFTSPKKTLIIFLSLLAPKLTQEYFIHYLDKMPWQIPALSLHFFASPLLNETTSRLTWITALLAIPVVTLKRLTKT